MRTRTSGLAEDWEAVADLYEVPPHAKARFRPGNEPRQLWEYLEIREKLYSLPDMPALADRPGFVCEGRRASEDPQVDLEPIGPPLRGFVQLAAIQQARLEPHLRSRIADRAQAVTTKGDACEYLVEVAAKLRAAGLGG